MGLYNLVLLALGAVSCLGIAFSYMYFHRGWRRNSFSQMIVPNLLSEGILFLWLSLARLVPAGDFRSYTSSALFTIVVGVMVQRGFIYIKEERKLRRDYATVAKESESDS